MLPTLISASLFTAAAAQECLTADYFNEDSAVQIYAYHADPTLVKIENRPTTNTLSCTFASADDATGGNAFNTNATSGTTSFLFTFKDEQVKKFAINVYDFGDELKVGEQKFTSGTIFATAYTADGNQVDTDQITKVSGKTTTCDGDRIELFSAPGSTPIARVEITFESTYVDDNSAEITIKTIADEDASFGKVCVNDDECTFNFAEESTLFTLRFVSEAKVDEFTKGAAADQPLGYNTNGENSDNVFTVGAGDVNGCLPDDSTSFGHSSTSEDVAVSRYELALKEPTNFFSMEVVDFGDSFTAPTTGGTISVQAYDIDDATLGDASVHTVSSSSDGYAATNFDTCSDSGNGKFLFSIKSDGIAKVVVTFTSTGTEENITLADVGTAFTNICLGEETPAPEEDSSESNDYTPTVVPTPSPYRNKCT